MTKVINVYGSIPEHLESECEAVERSTRSFPNFPDLCILTQIDSHDRIKVLDSKDEWKLILVENQLVLNGKLEPLIGLINEELPDRNTELMDGDLVSIALSYLGTPYGWGCRSREETDCSGLVYQVFRDLGVEVPRFCDGLAMVCEEVGELEVGDLIFVIDYKPVHVLIYLGEGRTIESCGTKGVFTTRLITIQERWGVEEIYDGMQIGNQSIRLGRIRTM